MKKIETINDYLSKAIIIATKAHDDQIDKADKPYILHPLYLMTKVLSIQLKIIAVLHDVLEDSIICEEDLEDAGFSFEIIEAIKLLTRGKESYRNYIKKLAPNWRARRVKLADLEHNLDLTRLTYPLDKSDLARIVKYQEARQNLLLIDMGGEL